MITLPPLPYAKEALEPHISARTLSFHYEKHHQGYVNTLNQLIPQTEYEHQNLEEIISHSYQKNAAVFNNAAQIWNHTFYWQSLSPTPSKPQGAFEEAIREAFGTQQGLIDKLIQAGLEQFGSGWSWLVKDLHGKLSICKTSNADLPWGFVPLLVCDVWEHAYYLDYQNLRKKYLESVLTTLLNWDFAEQRYTQCQTPWTHS